MEKHKPQWIWVKVPPKIKFDAGGKASILKQVQEIIIISEKLRAKISRVNMKANRVYLYELMEQFQPAGMLFTVPLIGDKYIEFPYARITLNNNAASDCTVDWKRHNGQWMSLYSGTLAECLAHIENDNEWFE